MLRLTDRLAFAVIGALAIALIAVLAGVVDAGPLDPTAPPGSTMKTLDDIPGSWSRMLPSDDGVAGPEPPAGCDSSRFECLEAFDDQVVLDRETGLVWERDATVAGLSWDEAVRNCLQNRWDGPLGYRMGWRLPSFEELLSLSDQFVGPPPLPPGHPFIVNTDDLYWTATSSSGLTAHAYGFDTSVGTRSFDEDKTNMHYFWCVRGGHGHDGM